MSTTLTRWRESALAPFDLAGLFPALAQEIRVEQYVDDGHFVVRAELPGLDPDKQIEVTVAEGVLRIQAERSESRHEKAHTEFHYGRFVRTIGLPSGALEETASAAYHDGVLEITFTMGEHRAPGRRISIDTHHQPNGKERVFTKQTPAPHRPAKTS
jgi:HSP20 family molecular chaperone IbpA